MTHLVHVDNAMFCNCFVFSWTQDLREECLKLRTRVFDLEQQNRALSVLFQQRIKPASDLLLQVSSTLRTRPEVWALELRPVNGLIWSSYWKI